MLEFLSAVTRLCPFLVKTPVSLLRRLASTKTETSNALVSTAYKCPVMAKALASRSISSSAKCPFATTVDSILRVGPPGTTDPPHSKKRVSKEKSKTIVTTSLCMC